MYLEVVKLYDGGKNTSDFSLECDWNSVLILLGKCFTIKFNIVKLVFSIVVPERKYFISALLH